MKKIYKICGISLTIAILICISISTSLTFTVSGNKTNAQLRDEIAALNSRMDQIAKDRNNLKSMINSANNQAKNLSSEITDIKYEIDMIDEQIIVIESLLEQYNILTAEQELKIAELQKKIEKEQKMLDDMIRMSYEYGGVGSSAEFIFSAENFSDLIMRMDLISYHLTYNDKVIESYSNTLVDIEKTKKEYEDAISVMNQYKTEQESLKTELSEKQAEAESKRATLLQSANAYERELAIKQQYINELDKEIKALAAMFAKEDNSTYSGSFCFPLPANVYRITSYYGYRKDPLTGKTAYHEGYDFACNKGTKIFAADDGTVVLAKYNGGYGNCVMINHGGGIMTVYGHCSSLNVVSGQEVKRGDVIAYVGSTGRSTGNHLHFEVRKNGALADPAPYLGLK